MGVIQTTFNASWKGLAFNSGVTQYKLLEQYEEVLETRKRTSQAIGDLENLKAPIASPTFTGTITIPTLAVTGNGTITGTLGVTGNVTLTGDLAINGGDLTSSATTFNLLNATTTTLNLGGAVTTLALANSSTATQNINIANGATISGSTKTINIGTGAVAGATTTIKLGSTTGTSNITLQGNTTNTGTITSTGLLTANGGLNATTGSFSSTLSVTGITTLKGQLNANGSIWTPSITTSGDVTIGGNLIVNGTTTTVNSTVVTIDDPILTLGGDTAPTVDDNKDRGIEFRWHNGTSAKLGFFGFDDSIGKFTFIPDATNTSEVFSGTVGTIVANLEGNVTGALTGNASTATTLQTARTIGISGDGTGTATSFNGSANITIPFTLVNSGVTAGTYTKVTVDSKGRVTSATNMEMTDIPNASYKKSCRCATTANIAGALAGNVFTTSTYSLTAIDGVTLAIGDRVLFKNQTTGLQNGIYTVTTLGTASVYAVFTRATDADITGEIASAVTNIDEGTTNGGKAFTNTFKATDTLNTTTMAWYEIATIASNVASATKLQTARTIAGVSFDGTGNISIPFANLSTKPTTLSGYGITDASPLVGSTNIVTVGTITSGIWNGETIDVANGGTGTTTSTGTGSVVLSNSPTLVTPTLGVATGTSFNGITGLASTVSPMNGTATVGTSTLVARQDHIHASDTTKANTNQTMYIGTTALAINRGTGALTLTGITSIDGSASKWTTARTITLTGAVTGSVSLDGSGNVSLATTTNHTHPQSQITDDNNHQVERTIQVKCVAITSTIPSTLTAIDGYTPVVGDLVLLASAGGGVNDGVYEVLASGTTWTRYSLYSTEAQVVDRFIKVMNGTIYKNTYWTCVNKGAITVGTTALKIQQQFGDKTGAGLSMSAQGVLSVTSSPILTTARTIGILTGDVTSAGSTFNGSANNTNATVIANNAVTNAKQADMATMTMKGNNTGATADPKDLTVTEVDAMLQITKKAIKYALVFG